MAEARNSHAMAVLDGELYAVGSEDEEDEEDEAEIDRLADTVERYDPATRNAWEEVAPMVTARHSPCVAVL